MNYYSAAFTSYFSVFIYCSMPIKGTYKGSSKHTLEVSVVIDNGTQKNREDNDAPTTFTYTSKKPAVTNNSYQRFLEMQQ